jgi:hypothetical protein
MLSNRDNRYIFGRSWEDLVRALRNSAIFEESEFDELIQLKSSKQVTGQLYPIRGVRTVLYDNPGDIVALVNGENVSSQPKSNLRAEAKPFVPAALQRLQNDLATEGADDDEDDDEDDSDFVAEEATEDTGIDHTVDLDAAARAADAARVEQVLEPPTQEEILAAQYISAQYRQILSRRHGAPKKGLSEARARWFLSCLEHSQNMSKPYRLLFLGPFPHALVCVEKLVAYAINTRTKARFRLRVAHQEAYEKVKAEVDDAMYGYT